MRGDLVRRGAAVGVAIGAVAAVETVRATTALHGRIAPALELSALLASIYGVLGLGLGVLLAAAARIPGAAGRVAAGIGSARALWPIALLAIGFAAWNELVRGDDVLAAWRHTVRFAIALTALLVVVQAVARPRTEGRRARRIEAALAWSLVPALLGAGLYAARPLPGGGDAASAADLFALAPRFEPEPAAAFARTRDAGRPRVLLIGVDGASWDRLERGIASGALPTFAALRDRGVALPLRSAEPTYSPRLWTSIVTGVEASAHGIEDFYLLQLPRLGVESLQLQRSLGVARSVLDRSGELRFVPVTSSLRRRKAIWNLADEAGLASAVIGLWATWPPEPLAHGVVVSDHASLARQQEWLDRGKSSREPQITTWPAALAAELAPLQRPPGSVTRDELASFVELDDGTWRAFESLQRFSKQDRLSAFRSSHLNDAFYARAAERIWRERRPDLLVLYLRAVDELSHFFYEAGVPEAESLGWSAADARRFGQVVDRAYAATDRAIAALVAGALADGDTLVALVSDHGWEREPNGRYNHNDAPPGVLLLAGAGVCTADCRPPPDASIFDVAPTLLARLGLPLSAELVGRPLDEAFASARDTTRIARYGAPLADSRAVTSRSDAELREKLEALGYVRR